MLGDTVYDDVGTELNYLLNIYGGILYGYILDHIFSNANHCKDCGKYLWDNPYIKRNGLTIYVNGKIQVMVRT